MGNTVETQRTTDKQAKIEKIYDALDDDRNGIVTRDELVDWILDERFVENQLFLNLEISDVLKDMMGVLDVNQDKTIERTELNNYLNGLPEATIDRMFFTILNEQEALDIAIRRVFVAMDRDGNKRVDKAEMLYWLQNERAWQDLSTIMAKAENKPKFSKHIPPSPRNNGSPMPQGKAIAGSAASSKTVDIVNMIDRDMSGEISFDELKLFFEGWKVRDLREFSEDQIFSQEFEKYKKDKSQESYDRLRQLKRDHKYVEKMAAMRAERVREKRDDLAQRLLDSIEAHETRSELSTGTALSAHGSNSSSNSNKRQCDRVCGCGGADPPRSKDKVPSIVTNVPSSTPSANTLALPTANTTANATAGKASKK